MAGVPLELVKYETSTGKFVVGEKALEVLRKVKAPLGVVAVCGRARQGKSFILNQLLQQTSGHGFTVGPTHRPCTKGLWMWSSPQRRVTADGSESYLVLLDTEGIDAYDQTAQYSTQIFSLAVLLSCLFVYNHMGGIDESALDRLSLVTEMTKHIRVKAGKGDDASLGEFTPSFLWLLRDFYLKLEEDGHKISAKEYLETALHPVDGEGASVKAKNEIRSSIKSLFPDRDCFALVRPMNDEKALADLDNVPRTQLRPEFTAGVANLVKYIFAKAQPKRFASGFMTGPVLAGLVEAYVKAINNGAVPTIATAWQGVAESECRRAGDAAEGSYKTSFNTGIAAEEKELLAEHQRCLELARATFADIAVGEEAIRKAHESKYLTSIDRFYKDLTGRKLAEAASYVNEMLYKANVAISKAAQGAGSMAEVQQQLTSFIEQYAASATGPTKWEKLAEFLKDTYPAIANQASPKSGRAELTAPLTSTTSTTSHLPRDKHWQQCPPRMCTWQDRSLQEQAIARAEAQAKQQIEAMQDQLRQASSQVRSLQERVVKAEQQNVSVSSNASALQAALAEAQQQVAQLQAELDVRVARCGALEAQLKDMAAHAVVVAVYEVHGAMLLWVFESAVGDGVQGGERRVAAAEAEAEARVRALQDQINRRATDMQAAVSSEQARSSSLQGEISTLTSKLHTLDSQLVSLTKEVTEWRNRCNREVEEKVRALRERDEARDAVAQLHGERDAVHRDKTSVQMRLQELQARQEVEERHKAEMQARLDAMIAEAQQARAEALALRSQGRRGPRSGVEDTNGHDGSDLGPAEGFNRLSIQELRDTLTEAGHETAVWQLANRKPAPKKADWVQLAVSLS
ncbi:hypothetical protein QJQ45_016718 [Haematococcus lacustris]|nr:hypothetical protein QJQ45_016718 [Haematococcus lacustris]